MHPSLPKVSIMIPTYGQANCIEIALKSALAQDYPNLEVLIIDDCSPDNTQEIVAQYLHEPRLKYHRNPKNLGRVANYHHALYDLVSGDWALNLDGDDQLNNPKYISMAIEMASLDPQIVCITGNMDVVFDDQTHIINKFFEQNQICSGTQILFDWHKAPINHLTALYHRPTALQIGFYNFDTISSDWQSLMRLCMHGKIGTLNTCAGIWNIHSQNASQNKDLMPHLTDCLFINSVEEYGKTHLPKNLHKELAHWAYDQKNWMLIRNLELISKNKKIPFYILLPQLLKLKLIPQIKFILIHYYQISKLWKKK